MIIVYNYATIYNSNSEVKAYSYSNSRFCCYVNTLIIYKLRGYNYVFINRKLQ